MKNVIKKTVLGALASGLLLLACSKKDVPTDSVPANNATGATKITYGLLDSIFLYAKQLYYWNTSLPTYSAFQPRNFNTSVSGDDMAKGTAEIFALTRYAINPTTGLPYEYFPERPDETKYSYISTKDADLNGTTGLKSQVTLLGIGNDLGFGFPVFYGDSMFVFSLFYENGPAANAGLKRGNCYVKAVNGRKFSSGDTSYLNTALNSNSISLTYLDTLGKSHDVTLNKSAYKSNPIFADTVLNYGSKKVGYFALLNFADSSVLANRLVNVFSDFNENGVTDLVVDLRYNGGGMVETSEKLANLIAPTSLNGKKMFSENYNTLMQSGQATMLKNIPQDLYPNKTYFDYSWTPEALTSYFDASLSGKLQLSSVCFIVSENTASASELLINNLNPYMNVKLIGTSFSSNENGIPGSVKTFGKPVGFFGIPIGLYDVWIPEFESRNSNNTAVPYDGMSCNVSDFDDVTHNFGDHREDALAQAIGYITKGSFITPTRYIGAKSMASENSNKISVLMSRSGGGSTVSNPISIKAFNQKSLDVPKAMVENFKTISRYK